MATSPLLGGTRTPPPAAGNDTNALGPSDNSDSGSDAQGAYGQGELDSDTDAVGTGERATVGSGMDRADADILPDHIERADGSVGTDEDGSPDGDVPDDVEALMADDDIEGDDIENAENTNA